MKDLYELLGVSRTASAEEIKAAYRKLARELHPDVNPGNTAAEERFKEVSQAYAILSDDEKRAQYDRFGTTDIPSGGMQGDFFQGSINDLFEMFFGTAGGAQRRTVGRDGEDVRVDLQLTLLEVLTGVQREVTYRKMGHCPSCSGTGAAPGTSPETCPSCQGQGVVIRVQSTFLGQVRTQITCSTCSGEGRIVKDKCPSCRGRGLKAEDAVATVDIPPGVEHGSHMHFPGRGGDPVGGGVPGDLYVFLNVTDDSRFVRQGPDLLTSVAISFPQAALGDSITIDGVETDVELEIPAGTQPGTRFKVRGAGLPRLRGAHRGDLYVDVTVRVPERLNEGQAKLLRDFAEASGDETPKGQAGLLGGLFKKKR
ncbi:MAG TPA: molecular chaperone DnaJ [Fimbriimonadaceae bacterium]|nr:molecular chaperone DnaJ [Fimbriimonadaceae bacterium]